MYENNAGTRVFQIVVRGWGGGVNFPLVGEGNKKFCWGERDFLPVNENPRRSGWDYLNLFQS